MSQEPKNRKPPRKKGYDYRLSGAYFVTICTHERQQLFGKVLNEYMELSEIGQIAYGCWTTTSAHFDYASIDCFVVMPNHVHAIVILDNPEIDQQLEKDNSQKEANSVGKRHASSLQKRGLFQNGRYIPPGVERGSLGAVVGSYKSAVTKIVNQYIDSPPKPLWQTNYHDRIIRTPKEFNLIHRYVLTNPARWGKDRFNDD